jgi:hypothetical protein
MLVDVKELLTTRRIHHPATCQFIGVVDGTLVLRFRGVPWWRPQFQFTDEADIEFRFENVEGGQFEFHHFYDLDWHDALEIFSVQSAKEVAWFGQEQTSIFCSAPLSDPIKIFAIVHDFLVEQDALYRVSKYLNAHTISRFVELACYNGFFLGGFPSVLADMICAELRTQNVAYTQFSGVRKDHDKLLVNLEGTQFFCSSAVAVFDD